MIYEQSTDYNAIAFDRLSATHLEYRVCNRSGILTGYWGYKFINMNKYFYWHEVL